MTSQELNKIIEILKIFNLDKIDFKNVNDTSLLTALSKYTDEELEKLHITLPQLSTIIDKDILINMIKENVLWR